MAGRQVDGIALGLMGAGGLLTYAGIRGKSVPSLLTGFVQGKSPASALKANPIAGSSGGAAAAGSGEQIAQYALGWNGHAYLYGGAPGTNGQSPWDCSSCVNYVVGVQAGLAIPEFAAGKYDGSVHGPPTGLWLIWTGCTTVAANSVSKAEDGDIIVGLTHMGIYTGGGNYMSAHDPVDKTSNNPVSEFPDPVYLVRRLNSVVAQAVTSSGATLSLPPAQGYYTLSEVQQIWIGNGGPANTAAFAASVALAESSGSPTVESPNPDGGTNVGLFQLGTKGVGAGHSVAALQDPNTNTRITIAATSGGIDWHQWSDPVVNAVGGHYTPGT